MTTANHAGADVERLCRLADIARASYYRGLEDQAPREADTELLGEIQTLCLRYKGSVRNLVRGAGFILGLEPVSKDDSELCPRFEPLARRGFPAIACVIENQIQ